MDLTGLTALDVAIGLAFLFFLLSTVCSSINEMIAGFFGWRAQELEKALRNYLAAGGSEKQDAAGAQARLEQFFAHPRIAALVDDDRNDPGRLKIVVRKTRSPSYLPPRAVALTLLDTFVGQQGDGSQDLIAPTAAQAQQIPSGPLRTAVLDALALGRTSLDDIRTDVEASFDEVMDRCSGWYKRRAQRVIFVIAAFVAIGLNVNTFNVADRLAKEDALRASVVTQAGKAVAKPPTGAPAEPSTEVIAEQVDDVQQLGLPLGWDDANRPDKAGEWAWALLGWLATIAAISLGAPFWFDVLGKLSRLRNAGKRQGTLTDDERAAEDRDEQKRRAKRA